MTVCAGCSLKASQNPQVLRLEQFVSMQKLFDKIVLQVSGVQHGKCCMFHSL